jgi:hypothetical protein
MTKTIVSKLAAVTLMASGLLGIACSTSSVAAPADAAAASGDGGCVAPVSGAACTPGQPDCTDDGRDVCCRGYVWTCQETTRTWSKQGLGCACRIDAGAVDAGAVDAGPQACGTTTCAPGEYCTMASGGAQPPDGGSNVSYGCTPIPSDCTATPTCACLGARTNSCMCRDEAQHPYVTCQYP